MPTALITGVSGQDGSYLTEFLLARGYRVIGTTRDPRRALEGPRARTLAGLDQLVQGEISAPSSPVLEVIRRQRPDEVYHLGTPSAVAASWADPVPTMTSIAMSTALLIDTALEELPSPRIFVAGSAEIFAPQETPLDEQSPRGPASPYGEGKLMAMQYTERARITGGLYAVTGVLFNHESPRRGEAFVSRKIVRAAVRIAQGLQATVSLGRLDIRRDWGFAGDYVRAMWLMLFQDEPEDLVIGTGVAHSIADFCESAFRHVGLDWREHVVSDPALTRPGDAPIRLANPARAKARLGWTPEVDFNGLVEMMVEHELKVLDRTMPDA